MRHHPALVRRLFAIAMATGLLLSTGCRERAVPGGSGHYWNGSAAGPEVVRAEKVDAAGARRLASAQWTRQACNLDMVDQGPPDAEIRREDVHRLDGFLLGQDGRAAGTFHVLLKGAGQFSAPARTGKARPDVAAYFGRPELAAAGFEIDLSLVAVPPGAYEVVFLIDHPQGDYFCESGRRIHVVE